MTTWTEFEQTEPELAARAHALISATTNCVLATIRADGSPRVSGIDPFFQGGELLIGSMPGSRKAADLRRDPRMALHGIPWESRKIKEGATDPGAGDVKITARAVALSTEEAAAVMRTYADDRDMDDAMDGEVFAVRLDTVVFIGVEDDQLVIDRWSAADGRSTVRRT